MRKPSKGFNKRDVNYHRNHHTDDHGKHFFKVLIGDFHKRLVIPVKFAKHFGDKIEGSITLESLGGYTFDVQVANKLGRIVLQSGWKSFVSAHDLKKMDFLVFKYDGMSRMKVLIFDPSGCEKVPPCFVPKYILPQRTNLNRMQKKKLKERLQAICSEIPIYVCVMNKSNISGTTQSMDFSRKYSDVCLPFKKRRLTLQCHGKSWEVMCSILARKDHGIQKRLRSGWARFARDNSLQLGDICLFEQLKTKKYMMNVHIIRKEYGTKMRKPCKGYKERDANYHRNDHTDDHGTNFFKILVGDFHKGLVIPGKFSKHFGDKIEGSITLESRGGHTFDVQVANNLGRIILQSGWKSFVSAYDLKKMDFLVFKYDGMFRMKVLIFDPSGCEKVPPCFVAKNAISSELVETPETKNKSWKQRDRSRISVNASMSLSNSSGGMTSSEDDEAHSVPSYMFAQSTRFNSMQKQKLEERLRAISSEIPIYVCVVKKSNISGRYQALNFSKKYSEVCLPFKRRAFILQCDGKSWEVRCRIQASPTQRRFIRISGGWARFACDNNLQLGDTCLFEPLNTKKPRMNVHIIRKE